MKTSKSDSLVLSRWLIQAVVTANGARIKKNRYLRLIDESSSDEAQSEGLNLFRTWQVNSIHVIRNFYQAPFWNGVTCFE